jgi:hypothetical protein
MKALRELSEVDLSGTEVTDAAVEKLRQDLPATVVAH